MRLPSLERQKRQCSQYDCGNLLQVRDQTTVVPNAYFEWTEGNPIRACSSSCCLELGQSQHLLERCSAKLSQMKNNVL